MIVRPKVLDLLKLVREKVESGKLRYSIHANERMRERGVIKPEVEYVLGKGHHNKRKDQFNEDQKDWDYAIEGKAMDGRRLRVIVAVIEPNLLVVTTIDLSVGE